MSRRKKPFPALESPVSMMATRKCFPIALGALMLGALVFALKPSSVSHSAQRSRQSVVEEEMEARRRARAAAAVAAMESGTAPAPRLARASE